MRMYHVTLLMKCSDGSEFVHDAYVHAEDRDDAVTEASEEIVGTSNCRVKKVIDVEATGS